MSEHEWERTRKQFNKQAKYFLIVYTKSTIKFSMTDEVMEGLILKCFVWIWTFHLLKKLHSLSYRGGVFKGKQNISLPEDLQSWLLVSFLIQLWWTEKGQKFCYDNPCVIKPWNSQSGQHNTRSKNFYGRVVSGIAKSKHLHLLLSGAKLKLEARKP